MIKTYLLAAMTVVAVTGVFTVESDRLNPSDEVKKYSGKTVSAIKQEHVKHGNTLKFNLTKAEVKDIIRISYDRQLALVLKTSDNPQYVSMYGQKFEGVEGNTFSSMQVFYGDNKNPNPSLSFPDYEDLTSKEAVIALQKSAPSEEVDVNGFPFLNDESYAGMPSYYTNYLNTSLTLSNEEFVVDDLVRKIGDDELYSAISIINNQTNEKVGYYIESQNIPQEEALAYFKMVASGMDLATYEGGSKDE